MSDYAAPVALGINPPDSSQGLKTMGEFLGLQQKRQALQGQAQENQQRQIETQRQLGLQAFFKNWDPSEHQGPDGTTDMESARKSSAYQDAGLAKPDIDMKLGQIKQLQLQNKQSLTALNHDNLSQFSQLAQGLSTDEDVKADNQAGRQKVQDAFENFSKLSPEAARVAQIYTPMIEHAPQGKLSVGVKALAAQGQDVSAQQAQTNPVPTTFDNGSQVLPATIDRASGVPTLTGQAINKTLTPQDYLPKFGTAATGETTKISPISGQVSIAPGATPQANPSTATAVGQRGQAEAVTARTSQTLAQAANTVQAQDALMRAKSIIESSESPNTGAGFDSRRDLKNAMAGLGIDTKGADDMNTLAKNLARFEASRATASGLGGTDAARELAHNGSPNTQLDHAALQGIVRQSLATEKALSGYAKVMSQTSDPQELIKNETAFRSIPHPIETYEYMMSRNKGEADQYLKEHGISHESITQSAKMLKAMGAM